MKKSVEKAATVPMTQTQKILAQTHGIISEKKAQKWLRFIAKTRALSR